MSSSAHRNVINPRNIPSTSHRGGADGIDDSNRPAIDMERVLGVLVENAPVAMAMFDQRMRYILANRAWVDEFGLNGMQPLTGQSQYEVFPGLHPGWRQVYERALLGHVIRSEHDAMAGPDGSRVIYRWEVRPWRQQEDTSVGGLMVTCERFGQNGITQRQVDSCAQVGQKTLFGDCASPIVLIDTHGVVQQANSAAARLCLTHGLQEGILTFWDFLAEGQPTELLKQDILTILETLSDPDEPESKIVALSSSSRQSAWATSESQKGRISQPGKWLFSRAQSVGINQRFTVVALPHDPTPRMPLAPTSLPAIANAVAMIAQPPSPDGLNNSLEMRRLQDDLARARQELRTLHEAGRTFAHRDTRSKQYLEVLPCGVLALDELGTPIYQNEPLTKLLGRPIEEYETVEQWLAAACPNEQHREEVTALWREDVWRRQLTRTFSLATADGLLKELEFQPVSLPGGGLLVSIQDATEKCRHEEQLRATEAKFRTLLQEAPIPVVLMDKTGSVFDVNHLAESLLGHPKNELRRYPLDAWLEPESGTARREALHKMQLEASRTGNLEVQVKQTDGAPVTALLHFAQVADSNGEPHCTIHYFQKQPAAVEPTKVHSRDSAPIPYSAEIVTQPQFISTLLLKTNVNGRIKECSARGFALLGITEEEALGRPLHQYFSPSDSSGFYTHLGILSQTPDEAAELTCYSQNGKRQSCLVTVTPRGGNGADFELNEMAESIELEPCSQTPIISRETLPDSTTANTLSLLGALPWPVANLDREKLLLSETHHRIKNHLQIISSLLNLESNTITDTAARNALRSSQNRVRSIADLHQHLYQLTLGMAESFTNFSQGLLGHLRECYQVNEDRVAVHFDLQVRAIEPEWLMPLALTLNETLSNSFEHAFPEGRKGEVRASLTFGDSFGELVMADNGIGLSESLRPGTGTGLGLKILAVFAEQMRGQLSLGRSDSGGTEIRLRFPIASTDN